MVELHVRKSRGGGNTDALNKRPLAAMGATFYISAVILYGVTRHTRTVFIILSLLAFAVFMIFKSELRFGRALSVMAAGLLAASLMSGYVIDVKLAETKSLSDTDAAIIGTVEEIRYSASYGGCYTLKTDDSCEKAGGMRLIFYSETGELLAGDRISADVVLTPVTGSGDFGNYLLADGITLTAESAGNTKVIGKSDGFIHKLSELRAELSAKLNAAMPRESGGFASALILGDKANLQDSTSCDFRALGISHVIALSGTHLTMLFAAAGSLLPSGKRQRLIRFAVLCPAVIFYSALTGFSSSVIRAGIMFIMVLISQIFSRKADSITSLSASVLLICLVNPYSPWDVGLQLSFTAVIGLIIASEIAKDRSKRLSAVITAFAVPAVTLPIIWLHFGHTSLAAPIANIIIVPVVSLFIPLLGILVLLSPATSVFIPLASFTGKLIGITLTVINKAATFADTVLSLNGDAAEILLCIFTLTLIFAVLASGKRRVIAGHAAAVLLFATLLSAQISATQYHDGMTVCRYSSKTDDAVCLYSEGTTVLIDIGIYTSATKNAAELGLTHGSGRIDALMFTHLHERHSQTLSEICGNYYVASLWLPVVSDPDDVAIAESLAAEAEIMGLTVHRYIPGERLTVGDSVLTAPASTKVKNSAHPVISFTMEYSGNTVHFTTSDSDGSEGDTVIASAHGTFGKSRTYSGDGKLFLSNAAAGNSVCVPDGVVVSDSFILTLKENGNTSIEIVP